MTAGTVGLVWSLTAPLAPFAVKRKTGVHACRVTA